MIVVFAYPDESMGRLQALLSGLAGLCILLDTLRRMRAKRGWQQLPALRSFPSLKCESNKA